jgi:hypothetical protein
MRKLFSAAIRCTLLQIDRSYALPIGYVHLEAGIYAHGGLGAESGILETSDPDELVGRINLDFPQTGFVDSASATASAFRLTVQSRTEAHWVFATGPSARASMRGARLRLGSLDRLLRSTLPAPYPGGTVAFEGAFLPIKIEAINERGSSPRDRYQDQAAATGAFSARAYTNVLDGPPIGGVPRGSSS